MNLIASVFFGQKNKFGIELEVYDALKRIGKARLWIKEKAIGEYKIRHKISYLKKGFKELFQNENELWNERFEGKNPSEIATLCWMVGKDLISMSEQEVNEASQFLKFSPYFGDQLDSACVLVYKRNNKFHFIWTKTEEYRATKVDYLKNLEFETIDEEVIKEVVAGFLKWFDSSAN